MQYRLLNSNGHLVSAGAKVGFCLTDSLRWDSSANSSPKYHCGNQGIQKGWGDVYTYVTSGQWIDITGLPDGYYSLEMTVNPQGIIPESNISNNNPFRCRSRSVRFTVERQLRQRASADRQPGRVHRKQPLRNQGSRGEANHAANAGGHSVWFKWTAPSSQTTIIDTAAARSTPQAGRLHRNQRGQPVFGRQQRRHWGVFNKLASRVIFDPVAGDHVLIAVDGYNGVCGNITINRSTRSSSTTTSSMRNRFGGRVPQREQSAGDRKNRVN
jgi:hypothetical protein